MEVTSRWWASVGAGLVFAALGVVAERPVFLVAAAGIGAWLVGVAAASSRAFTRLADQFAVEYTVSAADTFVDTPVSATLEVRRPPATTAVSLSGHADVPVGADRDAVDLALDSGDEAGDIAFEVSFPVAGQFTFPAPRIHMCDPMGLYRATFDRGPTPTVTVRPQPLDIHVGQAGEAIRNAYGEHQSDRPGPGVTTQEIRQYVPGDSARQIDWKATARLADIYVRETEGETDHRTALVVDHRGRMATGSPGETMLDYVREIAVGVVRTAADRNDPIDFDAVGPEGVTEAVRSNGTAKPHAKAEAALYDLVPTADEAEYRARSASRSRTLAARLEDDDSVFARVLRTYVEDPTRYVRRVRADPLVESVRRIRNRIESGGLIVIATSDDEPTAIREAVKTAIAGGGRAMLFLTPRCLFESTDLADLDRAYDRYLAFEQLRRDLDAHPRVTALEVAPETRVDAVLAHRRETSAAVR